MSEHPALLSARLLLGGFSQTLPLPLLLPFSKFPYNDSHPSGCKFHLPMLYLELSLISPTAITCCSGSNFYCSGILWIKSSLPPLTRVIQRKMNFFFFNCIWAPTSYCVQQHSGLSHLLVLEVSRKVFPVTSINISASYQLAFLKCCPGL